MTTQPSLKLMPRITDEGLETPTVALVRGGRRIDIVAIPFAAPDEYWRRMESAVTGPGYVDFPLDELGKLRGLKRRLAMAFVTSMRTLADSAGLVIAGDAVRASNRWVDIAEPADKAKIGLGPLAWGAGLLKLISTLNDQDKVRALYLNYLVTGPRNHGKRSRAADRLDGQLAARSERIAERMHRTRGDLSIVVTGIRATAMLAWFESNGYAVQDVTYIPVVPRGEFGDAYVEPATTE